MTEKQAMMRQSEMLTQITRECLIRAAVNLAYQGHPAVRVKEWGERLVAVVQDAAGTRRGEVGAPLDGKEEELAPLALALAMEGVVGRLVATLEDYQRLWFCAAHLGTAGWEWGAMWEELLAATVSAVEMWGGVHPQPEVGLYLSNLLAEE